MKDLKIDISGLNIVEQRFILNIVRVALQRLETKNRRVCGECYTRKNNTTSMQITEIKP